MVYNYCAFLGHKKINVSHNQIVLLEKFIEHLITNYKVQCFLFGSKSEFIQLCFKIVTKLKNKYTYLKLIFIPCKSESAFLKSEISNFSQQQINFYKNLGFDVCKECYDQILDFPNKYKSGKASYIKRNRYIIDLSDVCIFYYNSDYGVSNRNSGTKLAFNYATKKNKKIINVYKYLKQ